MRQRGVSYQLREGVDPAGAIPPELIVGAWAVDPSGRPTGEFIPNPVGRVAQSLVAWRATVVIAGQRRRRTTTTRSIHKTDSRMTAPS